MIFAENQEVNSVKALTEEALRLFPDPRDIIGTKLKVSWAEEACLDSIAGMYWPAILMSIITEKYREAGTSWNGFTAEVTFSNDYDGVIVTFKQQQPA